MEAAADLETTPCRAGCIDGGPVPRRIDIERHQATVHYGIPTHFLSELDALGIHLSVDKPADGFSEQENYSLAREAFHLVDLAHDDEEEAKAGHGEEDGEARPQREHGHRAGHPRTAPTRPA